MVLATRPRWKGKSRAGGLPAGERPGGHGRSDVRLDLDACLHLDLCGIGIYACMHGLGMCVYIFVCVYHCMHMQTCVCGCLVCTAH